jgi:hypothetical protein
MDDKNHAAPTPNNIGTAVGKRRDLVIALAFNNNYRLNNALSLKCN